MPTNTPRHTPQRPVLTPEDARLIWQERDAYRLRGCLGTALVLLLLALPLINVSKGHVVEGLAIAALEIGMLWGIRWGLRQAKRGMYWCLDATVAWWRAR